MTTSIILLGLPAMVSAEALGTGCDQVALDDSKQYFKELRLQYIKDPASVDKLEFRLAASDYIGLAELCYSAEHGEATSGQMIDEGGMFMGAGGAETAFDVSEYFLWGTKWGAGTSFTQGSDLSGPRISGGTVTYSFMADGIDNSAESASANVAITSLATYDACFLDEIELALGAWSAVADIQFVPITDGGEPFNATPVAHIRIGSHVFDGPGSVLAHAFFPPPNGNGAAGDTHFDSDEPWACAPGAGSFGLGIVALHEFGHAIGLGHNDTADIAVMDPFYSAALTFGPLADDIMGIGEIYGTAGAATTTFFGPVGIGTDEPAAKLEVTGSDGGTKVLVDETGAPATRTLFELQNPGRTHFKITNTDVGSQWVFTNAGSSFFISLQGTGGPEFKILNNGNAVLAGTLTELSDVNAKTAINDIDVDQILKLVSELPVTKWEYKDALGEAHIGPMAQDFYAAFGLGASDTGISTIDSAGVALAAIQALNKKLITQNQSLQQRVHVLEKQYQRMEQQQVQIQTVLATMLESQKTHSVVLTNPVVH